MRTIDDSSKTRHA